MDSKKNQSIKYCGIHQHSTYSLGDAIITPQQMAEKCKELNYPAVFCTDHGNMMGAMKLSKECVKNNIPYVPGIEFYMTKDHAKKERRGYHLTAMAQNNKGLENLYRLLKYANMPVGSHPDAGFYFSPRISLEQLDKWNEGIVITTGCMASIINRAFIEDGYEAGKEWAEKFLDIFGKDRFFIEIQDINDEKNGKIYIKEQVQLKEYCRKLAKELGCSPMCANDAHWVEPGDIFAHEIVKAMDAGATLNTPVANMEKGIRGRLVYNGVNYHLCSKEEMLERFTEEEVANTGKIAAMCKVDIPLKQSKMPPFDSNLTDEQTYDLMRKKLWEKFKELKIESKPNKQEYIDRIKKELVDVKDAQLQNYFMIVWDVCNFCHENNIPLGPGRGSAAGSICSYLLNITGVDPIKHNLIWERFYNKGRKGSMPDIDLDICINRRGEVVEYLKERFGQDRVYQMMTIDTMAAKAAVKDVGKVLGLSFEYTNALVKHIPVTYGKGMPLKKCVKEVDIIKRASLKGEDCDTDKWREEIYELEKKQSSGYQLKIIQLKNQIIERAKTLKKLFKLAIRLEDIPKSRSTHACAIIIGNEDLEGKIPFIWDTKKKIQLTGFDMYDLESMGFLKLDILGLKTLSVLAEILPQGAQSIKTYDDPKVYDLISSGKTKGVFQLESPLGKSWCKKVIPKNISELSDLISILRPGPLEVGLSEQYVENRLKGSWDVLHKDLREIVDPTYGVMIYQEQMLEIVKKFAGFDLSEADLLRKACGKKLPEEMKKYEDKFINGCLKNKYKKETAEELWTWILSTAQYQFNKSHSISYAILGYATAYCKTYHPSKFYETMLNFASNKQKEQEEIAELFYDAKSIGIDILPPDVSKCNTKFEIKSNTEINFGILSIKGLGSKVLTNIKKIKKLTWMEILKELPNIKINSGAFTALILSGGFDYTGITRRLMLAQYNLLTSIAEKVDEKLFRHILWREDASRKVSKGSKSVTVEPEGTVLATVISIKNYLETKNIDDKFISKNRAVILKDLCAEYIAENSDENKELSIRAKSGFERFYLGIAVTCSNVDTYGDTRKTHNLLETEEESDGIGINTIGIIENIKEHIDKNGNTMAFVSISDASYKIDSVIFSRTFTQYGKYLQEGRVCLFFGSKRNGSFIINRIEVL